MIKIFDASQVRAIDKETTVHQEITSLELMERAATAMCEELLHLLTPRQNIYIFAGTGNNGGDALVIARLLHTKAFNVETFLIEGNGQLSADCRTNKERFEVMSTLKTIINRKDIPQIPPESVIIDGLFGSGLNRPLEGIYKEVVQAINESKSVVYSIDIPSGMFMDDNSDNDTDAIIRADRVFSFQFPKLSLLLPENHLFCKQFSIVDIGLSPKSIAKKQTDYYFVELSDAAYILKPRDKFSHKGDYGRAFIIAGSLGKMGAAVLAARACLRSGVGLLTMHLPQCGVNIMQTAVPEAMVNVDANGEYATATDVDLKNHTVGIGSGLGTSEKTTKMLENLLARQDQPMVIDADALNIISKNDRLKKQIPENSILTPHPVEFDRLTGTKATNGYERLQAARAFAKRYKVYIVLKGAYSANITPEGKVYFNSTGNPGMATGGSGDVLTGILTSLLAQKYTPLETCILGVFLHGMAGDIAAEKKTVYSMLPSNIIDCLNDAFEKLIKNQPV